ncbi:MAG: hypothetical protein LBG44_08575 [Gemmatimonadota bacterium]|nr:hypothetical protein [Gemmatimonadota bacterium]
MALIADEANISREGKLNVLGVFDRIISANFPMVHPKMVLVFRIEAEFGDNGRPIPVRVRLLDEEGAPLFEAGGEIVAPMVEPGDFATTHQVFGLFGTQFERPGSYRFVVNLGDLPPHETPLMILRAPWPKAN